MNGDSVVWSMLLPRSDVPTVTSYPSPYGLSVKTAPASTNGDQNRAAAAGLSLESYTTWWLPFTLQNGANKLGGRDVSRAQDTHWGRTPGGRCSPSRDLLLFWARAEPPPLLYRVCSLIGHKQSDLQYLFIENMHKTVARFQSDGQNYLGSESYWAEPWPEVQTAAAYQSGHPVGADGCKIQWFKALKGEYVLVIFVFYKTKTYRWLLQFWYLDICQLAVHVPTVPCS